MVTYTVEVTQKYTNIHHTKYTKKNKKQTKQTKMTRRNSAIIQVYGLPVMPHAFSFTSNL